METMAPSCNHFARVVACSSRGQIEFTILIKQDLLSASETIPLQKTLYLSVNRP